MMMIFAMETRESFRGLLESEEEERKDIINIIFHDENENRGSEIH
jgi:hypothetical protein